MTISGRAARIGRAVAAAVAVMQVPARAAQSQKPVVRGNDMWFSVSGDQRVSPGLVATFNVEERRSYGLLVPRQLLLIGGVLADIGGGRRLGAGIGHLHATPNEDFGPGRATDEYRIWQQFVGSHRTWGAAWNHRLRWEQRWIAPVNVDGADRTWTYSTRLRHQLRIVTPLDGRSAAASRFYLLPNAEVFIRTSDHSGVLFDQTRLGAGLGIGVASRLNLESNVFRQSSVRTDGRHEIHHAMQFSARIPLTARPMTARPMTARPK